MVAVFGVGRIGGDRADTFMALVGLGQSTTIATERALFECSYIVLRPATIAADQSD